MRSRVSRWKKQVSYIIFPVKVTEPFQKFGVGGGWVVMVVEVVGGGQKSF